jgi:carboxymethylenebutenolidase
VPASLLVVGISAATAVLPRIRAGQVRWRIAAIVGGAGAAAAFGGAALNRLLPARAVLIGFAALMTVAGWRMLVEQATAGGACALPGGGVNWRGCLPKAIAAGATVGFLTGLFGVGGGFLIIPALVLGLGLPMTAAVGTSLLIVVLNAVAGFAAHAGDAELDRTTIGIFTAAAMAGSLAAARLGRRLDAARLRRWFAYLVFAVAAFVAVQALFNPGSLADHRKGPNGAESRVRLMTAAVHGESLDIPTPDGVADAYLAHPEGEGPHLGVLVYADAFGLRPGVKGMADRLAAAGYAVLVPNFFYRHGRAPVLELPDFIDPSQRSEIFGQIAPMAQALTPERAMRDAEAYLDWLAASPLVTDGPVGVTGYCMGGGLALRTAGTHPERVGAAAGFHAGRIATDAPDSPHLLAERITAELYFGHADQDPSMPAEQIDRLEKALDAAGVRYRSEVYEGALHGFTQADTAAYNAAAEDRHWRELLALFERTL